MKSIRRIIMRSKTIMVLICMLTLWQINVTLLNAASIDKSEIQTAKPITKEIGDVVHTFYAHEYTYSNIILPYREDKIRQGTDEKSSLVIFLHGGSYMGSDNTSQVNSYGIDEIAGYLEQKQMNSILLIPQCDSSRLWNETEAVNGIVMSEVLKHWIDDYVETHNIDKNRIYILGASAGGAGTWRMASDYSNLFAAAMPVASSPIMISEKNLANTPLCVVVGDSDKISEPNIVGLFTKKIQNFGGEIMYSILENSNHQDTCKNAFTKERLDWVFSHTKEEVSENTFILTVDKYEASVWGQLKINDVPPKIVNGRTMIPARFIAENLGADVKWDIQYGIAIITKEDLSIVLTLGETKAFVNGNEVLLDSPMFIENNRIYAPVRFIAENLGATVNWLADTKQIIIMK